MSNRPLVVLSVLFLAASTGHADVFNMGGTRDPATGVWTGLASLEFVTVGDPGNAPDTTVMIDHTTGYGAVAYNYDIGKYDVTNAQYAEFLTAKASSSDPYGLWSSRMSSDVEGGITRSGSGPYTYRVKPGYDNYPVVDVTWYNTVRFANWLTNGQDGSDTESGTYAITGSGPNWTVAAPSATQRAAWAAGGKTYWLLPSEDEWYKAVYYKGGSVNAGYWSYPTQNNTVPVNILSATGTNNANFYDYYNTGNHSSTTGSPYLTNVGAFAASPGPYGTFDQGGNVWQWNEALIGSSRGLRGGSWNNDSNPLASSARSYNSPPLDSGAIGFRLASVPEPGSITLVVSLAIATLLWRRRTA